jgi:pimeloyl-ACP methyl ester carboxylesterase/CRP-like cAMP-binding protein
MRVARAPSARRFVEGDADGGARAPDAIGPLGARPTRTAQADVGGGGGGGAIRTVVLAKDESGSFGFRLTSEMVVESFADGRAGAGAALAGIPIGWRIVAGREPDGGETVPMATLDEFTRFARACEEGQHLEFDLRQPVANPYAPQHSPTPRPPQDAELHTSSLSSYTPWRWRHLLYLTATTIPAALIAAPILAMPFESRTAVCEVHGGFAWFVHSLVAVNMLMVCLLTRLVDSLSRHRRRAGIWRADLAQATGGVMLVHITTTWLSILMDDRSQQQIGTCVSGSWLRNRATCLRAGFVWEPAASDQCAWFAVNWALDLVLRAPILRLFIGALDELEDSGLVVGFAFGNYGAASERRRGKCALLPHAVLQMVLWMMLVACAKVPVCALAVLLLRPLQPAVAWLASLDEWSDGSRALSPQMALVVALLVLPSVPNALQIWTHDSRLQFRRWRRMIVRNTAFQRAVALQASKDQLFQHTWARLVRQLLETHRASLKCQFQERRFPGRPLQRPQAPPLSFSLEQGAALISRSEWLWQVYEDGPLQTRTSISNLKEMSQQPKFYYRAPPILDTHQKIDVSGTHYKLHYNPPESVSQQKYYPSGYPRQPTGNWLQPSRWEQSIEFLEQRFGKRYFERGKDKYYYKKPDRDKVLKVDGGGVERWMSALPVLESLGVTALKRVASRLERVEFAPSEAIINIGERGDAIYFLERGTAQSDIGGTDLSEVDIVYEEPGEYFGELGLETDALRKATVRAGDTGATVLRLRRETFELEREAVEAEGADKIPVPELSHTETISQRWVRELSRGITILKYDRKRAGGCWASMRHLIIDPRGKTVRWARQPEELGKSDRVIAIHDIVSVSLGPRSRLFRSVGVPKEAEPWQLVTLRVQSRRFSLRANVRDFDLSASSHRTAMKLVMAIQHIAGSKQPLRWGQMLWTIVAMRVRYRALYEGRDLRGTLVEAFRANAIDRKADAPMPLLVPPPQPDESLLPPLQPETQPEPQPESQQERLPEPEPATTEADPGERAIWLWDPAAVARATSEVELVGSVAEGTDGAALLLGKTSLSAEDAEKVNEMLGRVSLLFMQDHAAVDQPYVPPDSLKSHCPYLWGPELTAKALSEAVGTDGAGLAEPIPDGLVGTQLLLHEGAFNEDDRQKVDAMLTRAALLFMQEHALIPSAAPESQSLQEADKLGTAINGGVSLARWRKQLAHAFIRPFRAEYEVEDLGGTRVVVGDMVVVRTDFELKGTAGKLQCSHWEPEGDSRPGGPDASLPCIVYLHGNCGSRMEALEVLQPAMLVPGGASVCAFDFAGCGHSEGNYISLGWWETRDLDVVLRHLAVIPSVRCTAVWGRSMGAVTALLYASTRPPRRVLSAMVLDSPFGDLKQLAGELVEEYTGRKPPKLALAAALSAIGEHVWQNAGFLIQEHRPVAFADRCTAPVRIVAAEDDTFVPPHHAAAVLTAYGGDEKVLVTTTGDHNSERPPDVVNDSATFLAKHMSTESLEDQDGSAGIEMRKQYQETIAGATALVEKWKREEDVAVGTRKGAEAREKRLEAEQVRDQARVAMSQLGEEEHWLVNGTEWFSGRSLGSMILRRPRPDQPPQQQTSTTLALFCTCIFIAAAIAGIVVINKWFLGHYANAVERQAVGQEAGEPTSSFVPCTSRHNSTESVVCVPTSECGSEATAVSQTASEVCTLVL